MPRPPQNYASTLPDQLIPPSDSQLLVEQFNQSLKNPFTGTEFSAYFKGWKSTTNGDMEVVLIVPFSEMTQMLPITKMTSRPMRCKMERWDNNGEDKSSAD